MGHVIFPLIGLKRILFTNIFQRKAPPSTWSLKKEVFLRVGLSKFLSFVSGVWGLGLGVYQDPPGPLWSLMVGTWGIIGGSWGV